MKKTVLIAALAAMLAGAVGGVGAYAGTSKIVGRDGPQVKLSEACTRLVVPKHTATLDMTVNVIGQQTHCLIRRPDPFARCVRKLGPAPTVVGKFDHGATKPADWTNVDKVAAYLAAVANCADSRLSTVVPA